MPTERAYLSLDEDLEVPLVANCISRIRHKKKPALSRQFSRMPIVPSEHIVYFDNFFTNYQLLHDLRLLGYRTTGTMRENRTMKCPHITVKMMKKRPRAEYDYRFDMENEISIVRWKDNNVVTIGTNYDTIEPLGKVKRWCKLLKQKVEFEVPRLIINYNKGMGGVD